MSTENNVKLILCYMITDSDSLLKLLFTSATVTIMCLKSVK